MAKTKISEFSSTPANNTDIDSINIAEGCAPSNINDAIRELMAQLKDFQTGAVGDSFNGPIGSSTASTGAFTNITASGTLGVTGVATLGAGAILNTPASVTLTNATGLPISTGVSGLGTGVATALAVNVGSAGAPVVNGGALGTPSSGTVTNLTGTASININGTVGATTPTTGAFTTTTVSTSETLSYGTANGVTYLNGSKVLTSGSALTFDGTNFATTGNISAGTNKSIALNASSTTDVTRLKWNYDGTTYAWIERVNSSGDMAFGVQSSEGMRLTSTGLGIGTSSPSAKLHVSGQSRVADSSNAANYILIGSGANAPRGGNSVMAQTGSMVMGTEAASNLVFITNAAEAGRFDSAGNLGLGVTPSAWSLLKAFQIGNTSLAGYSGTGYLMTNAYFDGSVYRYTSSNYANLYTQNNSVGQHAWYTAASGTAGDTISFTQAMSLTAAGDLLIGATSSVAGGALGVQWSKDSNGGYGYIRANLTTTYGHITFYNPNGQVGQISTNGSATTYATSSDYRLKNITGPITTSGAYIDSLNPVEGTWKADGSTFVGLIAHEVQEASRTQIATGTKDGAEMQAMDYSSAELIANLIAEVKSLRQRVATLEAQ